MKKILYHACCGVCSLYPIKVMKEEGKDFALYYANPNIHPYKEWKERKKTFVTVAENYRVKYFIEKEYPLEDFLKAQLSYENRCEYCYRSRLTRAADKALAEGYDAFSTTLTISPYQNLELIQAVGEAVATEKGIPFYFRDFREGFPWAQEIAGAQGLYRQKYCGCIFSERDRYMKRNKKKPAAGDVL
ncbi:MAG: epoxyqueuosine reductase QueH [Bacillota bacterium]|nr:epoxyqueuosine reductase QueH [Bacillota bacterium]